MHHVYYTKFYFKFILLHSSHYSHEFITLKYYGLHCVRLYIQLDFQSPIQYLCYQLLNLLNPPESIHSIVETINYVCTTPLYQFGYSHQYGNHIQPVLSLSLIAPSSNTVYQHTSVFNFTYFINTCCLI